MKLYKHSENSVRAVKRRWPWFWKKQETIFTETKYNEYRCNDIDCKYKHHPKFSDSNGIVYSEEFCKPLSHILYPPSSIWIDVVEPPKAKVV